MRMIDLRIKCESCGEVFRHRKACQNRDAAADYEDWAREHITVCPTCYRYGMERLDMQKNAEIISAKGVTLPEIDGTEKQIKWANKICMEAVAHVCAALRPEGIPMVQERLNTLTDARWWIDNRDELHTARGTLKMMFPEKMQKGAQ